MSKKQKRNLMRIIGSAAVFSVAFILSLVFDDGQLPTLPYLIFSLYLVSYLAVGYDILIGAVKNLFKGRVLDENFLMGIATVGAFALGEYPEGVAVMLLYQVGEWFQAYAVGKSRRSIGALMDIRPDHANRCLEGGSYERVSPEDIAAGEEILVLSGERIPLDGLVINGVSSLDTSSLTGESMPRDVQAGDEVISGCVNISGVLRVKVTKVYGESTVAKILDLIENQSSKKAKSEKFITRFAKYYTPAVVLAALLMAVAVPLLSDRDFSKWIYRALSFLVISCPCALVISIPLSFFGGIGGASKSGILIKGANYLEALGSLDTVVFDKTGTLTKGSFEVSGIYPDNVSNEYLLEAAAKAEIYSNHPVALSIKSAYGKEISTDNIVEVIEEPGYGVKIIYKDKAVAAGNAKLMEAESIAYNKNPVSGTVVHVGENGSYLGYLLVEDTLKEDSKQAISELRTCGVSKTVMLTGDNDEAGKKVALALGIDEVHTRLLPDDKVERFEEILVSRRKSNSKSITAYVGDGINDAPVLARADVGIAMGGLGSDAAIEAADVVIMDDKPSKIAKAIKISRKTVKIVRQNIIFALAVKLVVLILSAMGKTTMWAAIFADVGVSLLAVLNAMRALKSDK